MKFKTYKTEEVKTDSRIDKGYLIAHDSPFFRKREFHFLKKDGKFFSTNVEEAKVFPTMAAAEKAKDKLNKQLRERNHPLEGLVFVCEVVGE